MAGKIWRHSLDLNHIGVNCCYAGTNGQFAVIIYPECSALGSRPELADVIQLPVERPSTGLKSGLRSALKHEPPRRGRLADETSPRPAGSSRGQKDWRGVRQEAAQVSETIVSLSTEHADMGVKGNGRPYSGLRIARLRALPTSCWTAP